MKHLKTYKLFESRGDNIKNDIIDMSLEFQDTGFRVKVEDTEDTYYKSFGYYPEFRITIDKFRGYKELFDINEIKEFILRVDNYLKDSRCSWEIYIPRKHHVNQKEKVVINNENLMDDEYNMIDYKISYVEIKVRVFGVECGFGAEFKN